MAADTGRFDYLDGIRALAIGAVLSLHWLSWYSPLLPRRVHRRRRLLRPQRLHHHHDAVALEGPHERRRGLVGLRPAADPPPLPGTPGTRGGRGGPLRRGAVRHPRPGRGGAARRTRAQPGLCALGRRPERQLLAPGPAAVRPDLVAGHRVVLLPAVAARGPRRPVARCGSPTARGRQHRSRPRGCTCSPCR